MSSEPTTLPYPVLDYTKQSLPVPGTKRPGQTAHYRNAAFGLIGHETTDALAPLTTCTAIFDKGLRLSKDKPFLGHRPVLSTKPLTFAPHFVWETYSQVDQRRRNVGSALLHSFQTGELGGGELNTVGIWSQNRPEWQIIDIALQGYGLVGVSLYDTLGRDSVGDINHAHLTVIFATSQHIPTLLKLAPKVPILKLIVSIDDLSAESKSILTTWAGVQNVQVKELRDIEELGKLHPAEPTSAKPSDIVSLCYTSGTTNNPKGVVLKHGNLASAVRSNLYGSPFEDDATLLSYLPLAHIYERLTESCVISVGGRIGYFTGDPLRLLEDAQILRPHLFPSVPRVLNRVYQSAMAAADVPGPKGTLFRKAVQVKLDRLHTTGDNTHAFWDRLVFRKIQAVLGGNVKMVTSGSAPISVDVMDFLKIALACDVLEGESLCYFNCGTCTKVLPLDPSSSGTVGPPQPVNEVKLVDVPAMGYTSEDSPNPRGELCVRGANCFNVYYKDEKNTKETVDEEGWIHTGDVAEIDQHGRVKIVDRVKNIMKLAQGEYVALEKIENVYGSTPVVGQIYIHGDSLQSYLLAVIVPDPLQLSTLGEKLLGRKVSPEDAAGLAELAADSKVNAAILAILTKEAKRHGLKGFETVKRIHVATEPFSVENGTMTPTFKIRRKDAYNLYKSQLDGLYALGEPESSKL
ncbi:hypothetical protein PLICRDRAFT_689891 [Plicaturopsis crispa FD-325 SS-3]|nr:hypothetical protein PLICRDRAFT_689891 [Plicaturopsis crispa FD-325 SS-3]